MAAAAPPAPAIAGRFASNARDVMVTGARVAAPQRKRADWAACTIDDPRRTLSLCGDVLAIGASGSAGVAASHVAEGLRRAWQDDPDGAAREFDAAIAIAPRSPAAYLNRSLLSSRENANDRALADADKAVRYAPDSAQAHRVRAAVLRRLGKPGQADAEERRADEIDAR
jgi:tetratricopeptide (TPR) repeat protein